MAHSAKYGKSATGHMFNHYGRSDDLEKSAYVIRGNENIDSERTGMNYNLAYSDQPKTQLDFLHQRLSEIKVHNRKDINVMVDWAVTAPKDLPMKDEQIFFQEAYKFLNNRYGKENVISAYVHMDETTPHMHYAFVPVVENKKHGGYKLSAKEAITLRDLKSFHVDLSRHMEKAFGRDIGVLNEATKEGNKSIEELKRGTAQEKLKEIATKTHDLLSHGQKLQKNMESTERRISDLEVVFSDKEKKLINAYENKKNALEDKLEGLQRQIKGTELKINEINLIQPQKTITGAIKGVTIEDIENLKKTALVSVRALNEVKNLSQENDRLNSRVNSLEKQVPSIMDKMKDAKEKATLLEKANAFDRLPNDIKKELMPKAKSRDFGHER